ncbi:hypothetical protein NUSPORA_01363 [Nucleospora cyclopteri]
MNKELNINFRQNRFKWKIIIGTIICLILLVVVGTYFYIKKIRVEEKRYEPVDVKPTDNNDIQTLFNFTIRVEELLKQNKLQILKKYEKIGLECLLELSKKHPQIDFLDIYNFNISLCYFHLSKIKSQDAKLFYEVEPMSNIEFVSRFSFLFPTNEYEELFFDTQSKYQGIFRHIYTFDFVIQILKRIMKIHLPISLFIFEEWLKEDKIQMFDDKEVQFMIESAIKSLGNFGLNKTSKEFAIRVIKEGKSLGLKTSVINMWKRASRTTEVVFSNNFLTNSDFEDFEESSS